ncbi:MAG TPA: hypothetical protein VNE21_06655, partial [Mycobacteriales bacterium]|nr:hypothetical protein [Mycobacteriales bacterium]
MAGKQRERALARQRAMRRASRIADRRARARRRNTTIAAVTAGLVALGGLVYAGVSLSSGGHHSPTAA